MEKFCKKTLPLKMNNDNLYYNQKQLEVKKIELENFFADKKYKESRRFSIATLFSQGIKYNNAIEGYFDDLKVIDDVINEINNIDVERRQRIINLYRGYQYILKQHQYNHQNLKKLYSILAKDLLMPEDEALMGEYYRNDDVFIHYSNDVTKEPDRGIDASLISEYLEDLFAFMKSDDFSDDMIDDYLKSQIMHFYFVYVHPYYDINGRTARTLAMGHLLQKKAYPFLIFNRGLLLDKAKYYRIIRDVVQFSNASFFLNYMMDTVKNELEKEYIIKEINQKNELTDLEKQSVYNFLSFKKPNTILDFSVIYNQYNMPKRPEEVYDEMLSSLIEKEILLPTRNTNKQITSGFYNQVLAFNEEKFPFEEEYVKKYIRK